MNLKEKAKKLKIEIPAVFLSLKDKDTPFIAKLFAGIAIAYALSPIDLIPDFIPIFGYFDDIVLLPVLILITIHFMPRNVWEKNLALSGNMWNNGLPKKWYYSIPIILVWLLIVYALLHNIAYRNI